MTVIGHVQTADGQLHEFEMMERSASLSADSAVPVVSRWLWGACQTIEPLNDSIVVAGNGQYVQIFKYSNPESLWIVKQYLTGESVFDIRIRVPFLYVVSGSSLSILEIGVNYDLELVGKLEVAASSCQKIVLEGPLAFITVFNALVIVDITDPSTPFLRDGIPIGERFLQHAVKDRIVYIGYATGAISLYPDIIDASDPDNLKWIGSLTSIGPAAAMTIVDTVLYVAGSKSDHSPFIQAFSVSDSKAPYSLWLDTLSISSGVPTNISVADSHLSVSVDLDLHVYEIQGSDAPIYNRSITRTGAQWPNLDVHWAGSFIFIAQGSGLWLLRNESPDSIYGVVYFMTGFSTTSVSEHRGYGYLCHPVAGITILDLTDPINLVRVGGLEMPIRTGYYPWNDPAMVMFRNNYMYVAATNALEVFDVSDPTKPVAVNWISLKGAFRLAIADDFLYVAVDGGSVMIFDLSDPAIPMLRGTFILPNGQSLNAICVSGATLVLSAYENGVRLVDVSDPNNPSTTAIIPGYSAGVVTLDSLLYTVLISDTTDFSIYSIREPSAPERIGSLSLGLFNVSKYPMAVDSGFVYFDTNIVDVSDGSRPTVTKTFSKGGYIFDILGWKRYILLCDGGSLTILRNDGVSSIVEGGKMRRYNSVRPPFPNPFNSAVTIEYHLPHQEEVRLEVYDQLGRMIEMLIDEVQPPGDYLVAWRPGDKPSGVYFVRMIVNARPTLSKVMFLR